MVAFIANTSFGKFRVKMEDNLLSVGGKRWCAQIKIRANGNNELISINTRQGGCVLDKTELAKGATVDMVHLAFTICKELYPDITTLNLVDSSTVICKFSDKSSRSMGLMKSSLLNYGYTYYERKFEAIPVRSADIIIMNKFREAYADPLKKPTYFDFNNPDLQRILEPIYKESSTWKEFMEVLRKKYGDYEICKYTYPWYLHALTVLTESGDIPSHWKINLTDKPIIEYTKIMEGGKKQRKTRKREHCVTTFSEYDGNCVNEIHFK